MKKDVGTGVVICRQLKEDLDPWIDIKLLSLQDFRKVGKILRPPRAIAADGATDLKDNDTGPMVSTFISGNGRRNKKQLSKDKVSIHERPAVINEKRRLGAREITSMVGEATHGDIVTIVERQTGFPIMQKLLRGKVAKCLDNYDDHYIKESPHRTNPRTGQKLQYDIPDIFFTIT